ncbi:MAG: hypothetical protein ACPL7I_05685, partial [Myxococcota bacterium]
IEWNNSVIPDDIMKGFAKHNGVWGKGLSEQLTVKGLPKKQCLNLQDLCGSTTCPESITNNPWGNVDLDVGRKNISLWLKDPYTSLSLRLIGIKKYNVYFQKMSKNNPEEPESANWFYYWGRKNYIYSPLCYGANSFDPEIGVSGDSEERHYFYSGGEYIDETRFDIAMGAGLYMGGNDFIMQLNNQATMRWEYSYVKGSFEIIHNETGIDTLESTIKHEECHIELQKLIAEGYNDEDLDGLPDLIENSYPFLSYGFDWKIPFSYAFSDFPPNIGKDCNEVLGYDENGKKIYAGYLIGCWDDDEIYCEYKAMGARGNKMFDWAKPGKQHPYSPY